MTTRRVPLIVTLALTAALAVSGCSGSPDDPLGLNGCLEGRTGTIAVGVTNTSGEPIVIQNVELSESSGVQIIDTFITPDEEARDTAVLFDTTGRAGFDGVDLDQQAIEPDTAAFIGVEVQRLGTEAGRIGGLALTVDGTAQAVPVTLDLVDACD